MKPNCILPKMICFARNDHLPRVPAYLDCMADIDIGIEYSYTLMRFRLKTETFRCVLVFRTCENTRNRRHIKTETFRFDVDGQKRCHLKR